MLIIRYFGTMLYCLNLSSISLGEVACLIYCMSKLNSLTLSVISDIQCVTSWRQENTTYVIARDPRDIEGPAGCMVGLFEQYLWALA